MPIEEGDLKKHQTRLIESAAMLYAAQKIETDKNVLKSKKAYGKMLDAHMLITGVLGSLLIRNNGVPVKDRPEWRERRAIFAAYVIGIPLCETAIENGQHLQAATLIRQSLEMLAQLNAIKAGKRHNKKSPNINSLPEDLRRIYSELTGAAHVIPHWLIEAMTFHDIEIKVHTVPNLKGGTRFFPAFETDLVRRSFSLHLLIMLQIMAEMEADYQEQGLRGFEQEDHEALTLAIELTQAEGMWDYQRGSPRNPDSN